MEISARIREKTLIITLKGELDHHSAANVKELVEELIKNRGAKHLVFDFSHLAFMDSSGIGVIVGRYKLISAMGGNVAICGASRMVDRLLTMSGIKKIIATYETVDTALSMIQEEIS